MASPFKFFRKNQKVWLACLTILAMGGFVVLPTVMQMTGQGTRAAGRQDVVSTNRYGNVSRVEMATLHSERQIVRRFLSEVDRRVRMTQRNPQSPTLAQVLSMRMGDDEKALAETWLLVNYADEIGIAVDDAAVNAFLKEVTEGAVSQSQMAELLDSIGLSDSQLFRLLGYELKAMRIQDLVRSGLVPVTPGERWDYYQRLHRNMSIELAEVPVERFVGSLSDPDAATLEKFFDKYKDKEDFPESPEPGFRIPKRIAVEYFKVDYDHLFAPGELEKYYEEHKEEFKRESLPPVKASDPAPELKGSLPGLDDAKLDLPAAEEPVADRKEGSEPAVKPESEEKPAEQPKTGEAKDEAPQPTGAAADMPKEETAEPKEETAEPKAEAAEPKTEDAPKPTDESRSGGRSVFQLTAYQTDGEEKAPETPAGAKQETPPNDPPTESQATDKEKPAAEEDKPVVEEKAEEKKAEDTPAGDTQGDEKAAESKAAETKTETAPEKTEPGKEMAAGESAAAAAKDSEAAARSEGGADPSKVSPASEYYTFEEVKSQIQRTLAPDKIERLFRPLENQLMLYHDARIRYIREQDDQGNSSVPEPPLPDFAQLAAQTGIEAKKTELFSQREGSELQLDIAKSTVSAGTQPTPFLLYAFDSLTEHRPARSQDNEGNYYLFWKTVQEPERVPKLEEEGIRSMVVNSWKMIEARGAAEAEAERLAEAARAKQEASKDPASLATALAGEKDITVQSTDPFTWLDVNSIQLYMWGYGRPRLGTIQLTAPAPKEGEKPAEPETVQLVGSAFMKTVAGLEKGGIGVAWNEPKTVAYVVRMVDATPEAKELQSLFLSSADAQQLQVVASLDKGDAFREWIKSLEAKVGLQWHQ